MLFQAQTTNNNCSKPKLSPFPPPITLDDEIHSPNIQMSLAVVNLLKLIDSGAIHLIGSLPFEAVTKNM